MCFHLSFFFKERFRIKYMCLSFYHNTQVYLYKAFYTIGFKIKSTYLILLQFKLPRY